MQVISQLKPYLNSLEETINCPVTLEPLVHAQTLSCGHKVNAFAAEMIMTELHAAKRQCPLCRVVVTEAYTDPLARKIAAQVNAFLSLTEKEENPRELYRFLEKSLLPLFEHLKIRFYVSRKYFENVHTVFPCMDKINLNNKWGIRQIFVEDECLGCKTKIEDYKPDYFVTGVMSEVMKIKALLISHFAFDLKTALYFDGYYKTTLPCISSYLTPQEDRNCRLVSKSWLRIEKDSLIHRQKPNKKFSSLEASRPEISYNVNDRLNFTPWVTKFRLMQNKHTETLSFRFPLKMYSGRR